MIYTNKIILTIFLVLWVNCPIFCQQLTADTIVDKEVYSKPINKTYLIINSIKANNFNNFWKILKKTIYANQYDKEYLKEQLKIWSKDLKSRKEITENDLLVTSTKLFIGDAVYEEKVNVIIVGLDLKSKIIITFNQKNELINVTFLNIKKIEEFEKLLEEVD